MLDSSTLKLQISSINQGPDATFLLHSVSSIFDLSKPHPKYLNSETCSKESHIYILGVRECGFICWKVREPALVLFLLYVNVSGMCIWSYLSSQLLMMSAPWVIPRIAWPIPEVNTLVNICFLAGNRKAELKCTNSSLL